MNENFHKIAQDELLRAVRGARTELVDLESMTDEELDKVQKEFHRLRKNHGEFKETWSRIWMISNEKSRGKLMNGKRKGGEGTNKLPV